MDTDCCHCDLESFAYEHLLKESENFSVVCDVHPLTEGHLLIIPKKHLSCIGAYPEEIWDEFKLLYSECRKFIDKYYGNCCTFEHGVVGQTVFHSHLHLLPAKLTLLQIVPEGSKFLTSIDGLSSLRSIYLDTGKYLFVSIRNSLLTVDTRLAAPRFFRDRFAEALGRSERGNWKEMRANQELMKIAVQENSRCRAYWSNG